MDYELVNRVDTLDQATLQAIKERLQKTNGKLLCLGSMPNMRNFLQANGLKGTTLIDLITKRKYDPKSYRYFNEVNIPDSGYVEVLKNGSIFASYQGDYIAREYIFPNTRRAAQDIRFLNPDGSLDYIEEYTSDGKLYSHLLYANNVLQEIIFFNLQRQPVIRYYYYNNEINLVTVENPKTNAIISKYDSLNEFIIAELAQKIDSKDTVGINFLGIELSALAQTSSQNIYYLNEDPLDQNGNVRANLAMILNDQIPYIAKVVLTRRQYYEIEKQQLPVNKLEVVSHKVSK
ncbi:hypothetical protein OZY43_03230 [Lactobacillus sp. ESL0785]|uniref:hypothetical protein n=1 Tax=Lactobacillus sp. ESL0785 TaxID=2983232 RepID=UPI0023FA2E67|nr:hypothetical protein [Lactobacillus sp. ESL0785]WEV71428.1 hypothetical protein OZY43_03230 [Lactobacillus sp. ESL0785]